MAKTIHDTEAVDSVNISDPFQEIISNRPGFLIRFGIMFLLLILVSLIVASWFVKAPDIVFAKAKLKSINAPKRVIVIVNGKLVKLFAKEGEYVKKGKVLGFVESTANHEEVISLVKQTDLLQLRISKSEGNLAIDLAGFKNLGELQQSYQSFINSYQVFRQYLPDGFYYRQMKLLLNDLVNYKKAHAILLKQQALFEQDLDLTESTFKANETLKADRVISEFNFRSEKSKLISKKIEVSQISTELLNNEMQQNEKIKEIQLLENTIAQQQTIFSQSVNTLKSQIEDWQKKYLLVSPVDGKVAFAEFFQENQQLQSNQVICFVNPLNSAYFAEVLITQTNLGKVEVNQDVNLKFPSYPYQEYGELRGKIEFISDINTDSGYLARVRLSDGLKTTFSKKIQFREGLIAGAEVVTKDMRLLQRLYLNTIGENRR